MMSDEDRERFLRGLASRHNDPETANRVVDRYLAAHRKSRKYATVVVVPEES